MNKHLLDEQKKSIEPMEIQAPQEEPLRSTLPHPLQQATPNWHPYLHALLERVRAVRKS